MRISVFLFWLILVGSSTLYAQISDFAQTDFKKADSLADAYPQYSLKDLKGLSDKLTLPLSTEEEKFRAIYKWICNNIENDYGLYLKNEHKRKTIKNAEDLKVWNEKFTARVFQELLNKQKTVCTGYAYLLRELSYHAGLSAVIINGYGRTTAANIRGSGSINHSWNGVRIRGKWYLCDATWSAGAMDTKAMVYIKKFDVSYFLADPRLFVRNHYPSDSSWMLLKDKPTLKEFLYRPVIYSSIYKFSITQLLPATFDVVAVKDETVSFEFTSDSDNTISDVKLYVTGRGAPVSVPSKPCRGPDSMYRIGYTFATKGTYVVHVLLDNSVAWTYSVLVK